MSECTCKKGDTIIEAGQPGEWFYRRPFGCL